MQKTRMGYCPFSSLCRDREFWFPVATMSVVSLQELAGQGVFGYVREFSIEALCRDRFRLRTGFFLSRQAILCRDRVFTRVEHSCHNRRFYAMTGFLRVVLQQSFFFLSRPADQDNSHDRALGARTTGLSTHA